MQSPAVSDALSYPELSMAAKNEERRLAELAKHKSYHSNPTEQLHTKREFSRKSEPRNRYKGNRGSQHSTSSNSQPATNTDYREGDKCDRCGSHPHVMYAIGLVTLQRTVDRPKMRAEVTDQLTGKSQQKTLHPV